MGSTIMSLKTFSNTLGKTAKTFKLFMLVYRQPNKKADLARQIEMLESFCAAKGIIVNQVFSDIASGINERKTETIF